MAPALTFDGLIGLLHRQLEQLAEHRKGRNTRYSLRDAGLGAFAVFFTQSPSFLAYQRHMQRARGKNNAASIFGIEKIPSDNQIRSLLDPIEPNQIYPLFRMILERLDQTGHLEAFRFLDNHLLLSLDATRLFSSQKISCKNCSQSSIAEGTNLYFHDVIIPILVTPTSNRVITLEPEFIVPQDGHDKQDCEQAAAKRWIQRNAQQPVLKHAILLGDDLYCKQPVCELLLQQELNFIVVCKSDSHPALYEWIEFNGAKELVVQRWNGRFTEMHTYRYAHHVPLRRGDDALFVNWCELTITHQTEGRILYRNAFATNYPVTQDNVEVVVQAGRARWKSENESHNVLKTKGYHLEHNYGHGKSNLANTLLTLNLLAFLFHTALSMVSVKYRSLRKELATRQTFFNDIRALTRYLYFLNWEDLLDFMIMQLELSPDELDSS
jgi:hypothetical protein